jgi:hypothetical protein
VTFAVRFLRTFAMASFVVAALVAGGWGLAQLVTLLEDQIGLAGGLLVVLAIMIAAFAALVEGTRCK